MRLTSLQEIPPLLGGSLGRRNRTALTGSTARPLSLNIPSKRRRRSPTEPSSLVSTHLFSGRVIKLCVQAVNRRYRPNSSRK
ncbi:hypothetical protein HRTV-25_gp69 [Halorubrum tailed virus 25]|uniref:Uncharacterized protein n=1 Tax=Halorubrum tailed virus 25 TaxID=2878006 RepID=A0AAE8XXS3_9CAUD|nr:hypothetical protein M1M37_gp069 [Halorubrum tailed virus 25]UBF22650.1 hypothetical protein HRTV-25_gp69 [Halorubrum tailed virus 25]